MGRKLKEISKDESPLKIKRREYHREYMRRQGKRNRSAGHVECLRRINLKRYGITLEDYDKIYDSQNGCCAICNRHQQALKRLLAVDHCHTTGEIRGLLCHSCNLLLGFANDNAEVLTKAISYLNK